MSRADDCLDKTYPPEGDVFDTEKYQNGPGVDQEKVRTFNRQLIIKYLRTHNPTLRVTIAKALGLSRATVSIIVKELIKRQLVLEGEKKRAQPTGGKRATEIFFNVDAKHIVGVDIGRSRLRLYLTNLTDHILDKWSEPFDTDDGWEKGLNKIAPQIDQMVKKNLRGWDSVGGIGIGIPGAVDHQAKLVSPQVLEEHWGGVDIPEQLRIRLNLSATVPVYLENDANLGALGESRYGAGQGVMNMIYVKMSTGIGAGLILNGELYRGESGLAGEFGHLRLQFDEAPFESGPVCPSCHQRGCLEALAGLRAIVNDVRGYASERTTANEMVDVIKKAEDGDENSLAALKRAGRRLGTAIGSDLLNGFNPSLVLLDGGIIRPGKDYDIINSLLLAEIERYARLTSLPAASARTRITLGALGDDAVGLGAVAMVIDRDPRA
ncbi:MAG TPA: ROK family protein [Ktedonobacteraceae bacterium]|nr:ROK family protein [Ktedonobacteraceae bacterium]